ncbi:MAG TPA: NAD+ synthase [Candidatus Deferrimicrobiaceae bacterium]|nr:NAD+ synthase [Candidatus Deferrimicrobiaceae bacterium]
MKLMPTVLEIDFSEAQTRICRFIKEYVQNAGAKGIVLGLSGGVDSSTIAALSSLAIGGENVLGLMMPEKETFNQKDVDDAKSVAELFHLETQVCDLTNVIEAFYKDIPAFDTQDKLCKGNIKARTRMIYLYYYANKQNRIVCGSSDKSETLLGYFTKWGDAAADIAPILDLYKTQVRKLALQMGIPKELALKPSTPGLWPNQLAETELGIKYDTLDLILYGLERFMSPLDISEQLGVETTLVERLKSRWLSNEHKRRLPLPPKIGFRTVGNDFRLPRHKY